MFTARHDTSIAVPEPAFADAAPFPFDAAPLRRNGDESEKTLLIGRFARVETDAVAGCDLFIGTNRVLASLRVNTATCLNSVVSSIGVERTCAIDSCHFRERLMVPYDVAALVAQWSTDAALPVDLEVRWCCQSASGDLRWNTRGPTIVVHSTEAIACVSFAGSNVVWDVRATGGNARIDVRATVRIANAPVCLYATADPRPTNDLSGIETTFRLLHDTVARARAHLATQRRRITQDVSLSSAETALDSALEWAKQTIAVADVDSTRDAEPGSGAMSEVTIRSVSTVVTQSFLNALAALATGAPAVARDIISALPHGRANTTAADTMNDEDAIFLLLIARYHAWTADSPFLTRLWTRVDAAVARAIASLASTSGDSTMNAARIALVTTALAEIGGTANDVGQRSLAADIESRVKRARIDNAAPLRDTHWLAALNGPTAVAWRAFVEGRPHPGAAEIRNAASSAAARPAMFIVPLLYGMFGVEPEAARNRVRMRVQLPDTWTRASLSKLRIADATLSLHFEKMRTAKGTVYRYTAEQQSGAIPIRLIFEPVIAGEDVGGPIAASVDGMPASLDAVPFGKGLMLPVQVVLDEVRVIELAVQP